jgi:hypothetical protein
MIDPVLQSDERQRLRGGHRVVGDLRDQLDILPAVRLADRLKNWKMKPTDRRR